LWSDWGAQLILQLQAMSEWAVRTVLTHRARRRLAKKINSPDNRYGSKYRLHVEYVLNGGADIGSDNFQVRGRKTKAVVNHHWPILTSKYFVCRHGSTSN
jgi:hypothetical protein